MVLVAKYSLNGNANDSAGAYNGTATNVTWVDGKSNQAGSFNGVSSRISISHNSNFSTNKRTISTFIRLSSLGVAQQICNKTNQTLGDYEWHMRVQPNNKISLAQFRDKNGNTHIILESISVLTTGVLYYIVGVIEDGISGKIYINGILNNSTTTVTGSAYHGTVGLGIGSRNDLSQPFNGLMDEVEIYNTALTPAEIKNKYLFYNGFM